MSIHRIRVIPTGRMDGRSYLILCPNTKKAAIVDPDTNADAILAAVAQEGVTVRYIILTHCHFDHVSSSDRVRAATGAQVAIHRIDAPSLAVPRLNMSVMDDELITSREVDVLLEEGSRLTIGGVTIDILLTPGHTPGSICLQVGQDLLSGDTLFRGSYGNPGFPGGDIEVLRQSCNRLFLLPVETRVYPGHGESTTIGQEQFTNPILL